MTGAAVPTRTRKPSSLRYYQDGPPEHVDLPMWRLEVQGSALAGATLGIADLQALPRVEENRRFVCVCNWSIRETYQGYLLADVLAAAGWTPGTSGDFLKQTSIGTKDKGVYCSTIPLAPALDRGALLIDRIDGEPLSLERGFPLRLIDFGLYGYKGVKGLRRLELTDDFELGEWEAKAGYALDGEIQPKRYRACDLGRHIFVDRPGEVTDI